MRTVPRLLAALASFLLMATTVAITVAITATPALAYLYWSDYPVERLSKSIVTRLTLEHGVGWLTVQPRLYARSYTGFEVRIPAGDGQWHATPVVPVPELGIVCREEPGIDLHYRCGETQGIATGSQGPGTGNWLPVGKYQVSFRVQHTGNPNGLIGTSHLNALTGDDSIGDELVFFLGPVYPDRFPVHTTPHPRSTAEINMAPLFETEGPRYPTWGRARVATTMTVVPGERVTALDIELPPIRWQITGTNAERLGMQCFVRTNGPSLHCRPQAGAPQFLAGRRVLAVELDFLNDRADPRLLEGVTTTLALSVDGDLKASYDDFDWHKAWLYR